MTQYWNPEHKTAIKSPWSNAVSKIPPIADIRVVTRMPRVSEETPAKVKVVEVMKKEMVTPVKTNMYKQK
jgi:hypothetical protein